MKRKIISTLFALVLVLSFSLVTAVPAGAEISTTLQPVEFTIGPTGGVAEWTTDKSNSGNYSVRLSTEGVVYTDGNDYGLGRVTMPVEGLLLEDITSFSFYWTADAASGLPYPYFALDTDADPGADN